MEFLNTLDQLGSFFEIYGYLLVFFSSLLEITPIGWAIPGGAILLISGYLANGSKYMNIMPVIIYGTFGTWFAFLLAYLLGSKTGMWLVKKLKQEKNARFAKHLLQKNGGVILTTSMLANLTRFWISYIAGVDRYNFLRFNLYAFVASLTWVSLVTLVGFFAGYEKAILRDIISKFGYFAWSFLLLAIIVIVRSVSHEYKHFKEDAPHQQDENNK